MKFEVPGNPIKSVESYQLRKSFTHLRMADINTMSSQNVESEELGKSYIVKIPHNMIKLSQDPSDGEYIEYTNEFGALLGQTHYGPYNASLYGEY